ncbi:hypothetical protein PROFUN_11820 [Planoprotostelium fungivorum]|uniref:LRR receptor-like serine/threonine-protein kinase n=1 Tax=Planoprotostelium fungivorum TaxID=1890364 RepID=A0A2P6N970_9EUKA|nr:hypothetical protein PROFUN_11820 [Planoprotostelium fungivorum]
MGRLFQRTLSGVIWTCNSCGYHLANTEERISKDYTGRHGKAFLFNEVVNVMNGSSEERWVLLTRNSQLIQSDQIDEHRKAGNTRVKTTFSSVLTSQQQSSKSESQKFKVGKFILERGLIVKEIRTRKGQGKATVRFLGRNLNPNQQTLMHVPTSSFILFGCLTLMMTVSSGSAVNLTATLQDIWQTLNGSPQFWSGPQICNQSDYIGVTCDSTHSWPTSITLSSLNLTGTISPSIGSLTNLTWLNLTSNTIGGSIPDSIGKLSLLQRLYLNNNQLNGTIPSSINNLHSLQVLWLFSNSLSGPIPPLSNLSALYHVNLQFNQLNGPIPSSLGDLPRLSQLMLSGNQLSGPIPSSIGQASSLTQLLLGFNRLNGSIPSMSGLNQLYQLELHVNHLTGDLSSSLVNLFNLTRLNVRGNALSGAIPSRSQNLPSLLMLGLNDNFFTSAGFINVTGLCNLKNNSFPCSPLNGLESCADIIDRALIEHIKHIRYIEHIKHIGYIKHIKHIRYIKHVEYIRYIKYVEHIRYIKHVEHIRYIKHIRYIEHIRYVEHIEHIRYVEHVEHIRFIEHIKHIRYIEHVEHIRFIEHIKHVELTVHIKHVVHIQHIEHYIKYIKHIKHHLYDNNTKISTREAQNILNGTLQNGTETVQIISAVVLALLRNTTSFSYNSGGVSIKLETYNETTLRGRESIFSTIEDTNLAVALPTSIFGSQSVSVSLSSVEHNPFESIYNEAIYSPVVGVSVYAEGREIEVRGVSELINVTMGVITTIPSGYEGVCQYWNETYHLWSRDGCSLVVDGGVTVCQCTHLTNFSIGVQPRVAPTQQLVAPSQDNSSNKTKLIIIIVCCSVGGLLLILIVSLLVYRRRSNIMKNHLQMNVIEMDSGEREGGGDKIEWQQQVHRGHKTQVWKVIYNEATTAAVKKREEKDVRMLAKESTRLKSLHHPNIVQFLARNLSERWIMMEWMEEGSLHSYSQSHSVSHLFFTIGRDIAKGMSYVAEQNIVHSRLDSHHILLRVTDDSVVAKVTGFSRSVQDGSVYDEKPTDHTAPEVVKTGRQYLPSDVWSFGCLLNEMNAQDKTVRMEEEWMRQCNDENMNKRPEFRELTRRLIMKAAEETERETESHRR